MKTRLSKIVVGVDFSDASLAGARWVANHLAPGAELLLVHVVPVPKPPIYLHEHMGPTIDQRSTVVPRLYTALRGFAELLRSDRVRVGIRTGVPWTALARVASEVKADLIGVGRGQKRQGSSRFGATTPQRLLGVSHVPVLVIPQGVVAKPNRVLAAISGRPGGERVIPIAQTLAEEWGSRLDPVHVIETDVHEASLMPASARIPTGLLATRSPAIKRTIGIDALDQSSLELLASKWVNTTFAVAGATRTGDPLIRAGDPGQELIAAVREETVSSVIVIGRLGESVPNRPSRGQYTCGSTTRMVLWAAPCPVMVVPTEQGLAWSESITLPLSRLDALLPVGRDSKNQLLAMSTSDWRHAGGNDAA